MRDKKLKDNTMNIRITSAAGLMLALAGCTTIPSMPSMSASNPVSERWVGQSAGRFFAAYGPPISDHDEGGGRVYNWRGGYKTIKVAAHSADSAKKGKATGGHSLYLSCKADIETDSSYVIRSIHILGDMPSPTGPSYCAELLAPPEAKS
jgi:hypothetical protein